MDIRKVETNKDLNSMVMPRAEEVTPISFETLALSEAENPLNLSAARRWVCTITGK